jgi:sporadic carbohydrate cluster protein (TIGR04323 family)
MLPERAERRHEIYRRFLDTGTALHAALEAQVLRDAEDIGRFEDLWLVRQALARAPKVV